MRFQLTYNLHGLSIDNIFEVEADSPEHALERHRLGYSVMIKQVTSTGTAKQPTIKQLEPTAENSL